MEHLLIEWSNCSSWLAVGSRDEKQEGRVSFHLNSDTAKTEGSPIALNAIPTSIRWHPIESIIAVGWADGTVIIDSTLKEYDVSLLDCSNAIFSVEWGFNGKILCVVDKKCNVLIYSYSHKKTLSLIKIATVSIDETPMYMAHRILYDTPLSDLNESGDEGDLGADGKVTRKIGFYSEPQSIRRVPIGTAFFIGTDSNKVHRVDDKGQAESIYQVDNGIRFVGFCESRSILLLFTEDLMLHQVAEVEGKWKEKFKVKLSGKIDSYRLLLADSLLLMSYGEREIRVWDLDLEENGTLSLQPSKGFSQEDVGICVAFSKKKGMITAGTLDHKVANWRRRPGESIDSTWRLQTANTVEGEIKSLSWSPVLGYLAVNTGTEIVIIQDESSIVTYKNKIAAIQSGKTTFTLLNVVTGVNQELKLDISPTGLYLTDRQMCVWDKDTIVTYDVQTSLATLQSFRFACKAADVVLYQQTLYCIEGEKIVSRTTQGTVRQILPLPEMEGDPVLLSKNKNWLAVATSNGFLRVYDISKKEARQEYHSKYVVEAVSDFHKWHSIKLNIAGNRIAATYFENGSSLSDRIIVWDAECDSIFYFSFDAGMTDQQEYEAEAEAATTKSARPVTAAARQIEKAQSRYRMMLHRPGPMFWDEFDSRYLVCEAVHTTPDVADNMLLSMFVTSDHGLQLHDLQKKSAQCDALIGVAVPHMYFLKKSEYDDEDIRGEKAVGRLVVARSLREFAGLEDCNEQTRTAMLDFSLYLTLGRMDDAFKAIKFIKSDSVWEQMASMAVKTRRLDVAAVCLGHMKNVRGARALRKAQQNGENEAMQCAAIALELGMLEEAEVLYSSEGRYDMVNRIEQAQICWTQAFDIAARKDRIHLRNTHYNYAKYLEEMGQFEAAADNYERSETHVFEVPRMFSQNDMSLEQYIRRKREPELNKWWARYLESIGEMEGATNFYQAAGDTLSVCRIMCMIGKTKEAAALALKTNDKSACYHMARTYEIEGEYEDAVTFYSKATTYSSAIRIAREHDMRDKLANLCLMAGESEMVEAARYYEDLPGYAHKAVMLYHKAGMIGRALDLAFRTEQFSALDLVAKDLDASCDENTLKRAAEFYESNQNYKKAVELLCMAKDFNSAITLCRRKNVTITDDLAELLLPTKETTPSVNERKEINISVGELCFQQGNYIMAARKLSLAGETIKAMRALLRSGDTKKIRFFANTARNKEVYILAANYLQTTEWQGDEAVIKDIETFYTKSHSPEHLANFYISCAYMEIENWNDFDKAESALRQSSTTLEKALAKTPEQANLLSIKAKIDAYLHQLARFSKIKGVYVSDPTDAVRQLQTLAEESSEDDIIRPAHVFALLISHHAGKENWNAAYRCVTQLQKQQPSLDLATVVHADVLNKICDEMRVPRLTSSIDKGAESDEAGEEVDFSHAMKRRQNDEGPPF